MTGALTTISPNGVIVVCEGWDESGTGCEELDAIELACDKRGMGRRSSLSHVVAFAVGGTGGANGRSNTLDDFLLDGECDAGNWDGLGGREDLGHQGDTLRHRIWRDLFNDGHLGFRDSNRLSGGLGRRHARNTESDE